MATKWQTVLDLARDTLNDADKDRYEDAEALRHGNAAVHEVYGLRPDLRLGSFGTPYTEATDPASTDFPLPDRFKRPVADYIIGRLEFKDDTHVNSNRAVAAMKLFQQQVLAL